MSETGAEVARRQSQLDYLPIGLFGSVMGLTGLSVAWRLALARYGGPAWLVPVAPTIGIIAIVVFVAILAGYAVKALTAFDAVRAEFRHPIAGNLFGTQSSACCCCRSWWRLTASSSRRRPGSPALSA